eukprot:gene1562-4710_t
MYKLDIPPDPREAAKIEGIRKRAEERKERLLNARQRKFGLDTEAIALQIEEKKRRKREEKEHEAALDAQMLEQAKMAMLMEKQQQMKCRIQRLQDEEFRRTAQRPETRREFDINDPSALKNSRPVTEESPEQLGASSLQVFEGEDSSCLDRIQHQKQQQREWLAQQLKERLRKQAQEREEEQAFQSLETCQALLSEDIQQNQERARRDAAREAAEINKAMCEEKKRRQQQERIEEWQKDYEEIMETVSKGFVAEKREDAVSHGPCKLVTACYRGMTEEEARVYHQDRERQKLEAERRRAQLAEEERILQEESVALARQAMLREREIERQRKEQMRLQMQENALLAEEQKKKRQEEQRMCKNEIDPSFYSIFNRDAR